MAVFTAKDILALGATSIVDVLRMVPGLNVESTGREGALASLFARGGESDYNLVLIDGVRVNPSGGQFDFSRVSGAEIDRLEVVRGGQSSLYGSDAIGSVVQVFTKRAAPGDALRAMGSLEGGSFDTWRGDASVLGGAERRVDYRLGVAYRGSEGAFQDILREHDTFHETSVNAGAGVILGDRAALRPAYTPCEGQAPGAIDRIAQHAGGGHARPVWPLDFTDDFGSRGQSVTSAALVLSLSANPIAGRPQRVRSRQRPGAVYGAAGAVARRATLFPSGSQTLAAGRFGDDAVRRRRCWPRRPVPAAAFVRADCREPAARC
jgi:outer membrane receptor protein involved in Fe transport